MEAQREMFNGKTHASTNGPGYGSDFWYKFDNFKLKMIAGKNMITQAMTPVQKPFCRKKLEF